MIPAVLGNILGVGLFVGAVYWYLHLTGVGPNEIRFDLGGLDSAMEAQGPMGPSRRKMMNGEGNNDTRGAIEGREPEWRII